jgi:uncharacterized membrane protein
MDGGLVMEGIQAMETRRRIRLMGYWIAVLIHVVMSVLLAVKVIAFWSHQDYLNVALAVAVIFLNIMLLFVWCIRSRQPRTAG